MLLTPTPWMNRTLLQTQALTSEFERLFSGNKKGPEGPFY
jgi:hypothetical protein